ncbi:MAG: putative transposase [Candidatus Azotimanducaceae bacterium]|jgi:putative transposase
MIQLPKRKHLPHEVPDWVADGATYFITVNCRDRGKNQLAFQNVFEAIRNSAENYSSRGLWHIQLMVIIPDHIHSLVTFNTREKTINTIIGGWKRYLAKTQAIVWQSNYFEHRIRNQNELIEKEAYIRQNPVRAELCVKEDDWPYVIHNTSGQ